MIASYIYPAREPRESISSHFAEVLSPQVIYVFETNAVVRTYRDG